MKSYTLLALTLFLTSCSFSTETTLKEKELEHYQSESMKTLGLPFSDAVIVDDIIYLSGQVGNLPGTLDLAPGGLQGEAKQAIENIKYFTAEKKPARSAFGTSGLALGARLEIECIALKRK